MLDWSAAQSAAEAGGAKPAGFHVYRAEVDPATAEAAVINPSQAKLIAPEELLAQTTATVLNPSNDCSFSQRLLRVSQEATALFLVWIHRWRLLGATQDLLAPNIDLASVMQAGGGSRRECDPA